jgi:hypothetical protein
MWNKIWEFAIQHHFYQTIVLLFIIGFVLNIVSKSKIIQGWSGKITRFKIGAVEVERRHEDSEKDKQQDSIVNQILVRLSCIENKIESLFSIVADHEELFGPVSQGTLENMLFNEGTPTFRRLKSFLRLLALDVNGRVKKKGMTLILANKETWLDALETMPKLKLKIINKEHFEAVLDEINHKIYDGTMR